MIASCCPSATFKTIRYNDRGDIVSNNEYSDGLIWFDILTLNRGRGWAVKLWDKNISEDGQTRKP